MESMQAIRLDSFGTLSLRYWQGRHDISLISPNRSRGYFKHLLLPHIRRHPASQYIWPHGDYDAEGAKPASKLISSTELQLRIRSQSVDNNDIFAIRLSSQVLLPHLLCLLQLPLLDFHVQLVFVE